jgi:hypothetical protein
MKNHYRTTDLALSACLVLYCPDYSIKKNDPTRVEFIFERNDKNDKLDLVLEKYWSDTLKVSPIKYFNSLKLLKTRIYQK